jgi:hypothetical protein
MRPASGRDRIPILAAKWSTGKYDCPGSSLLFSIKIFNPFDLPRLCDYTSGIKGWLAKLPNRRQGMTESCITRTKIKKIYLARATRQSLGSGILIVKHPPAQLPDASEVWLTVSGNYV